MDKEILNTARVTLAKLHGDKLANKASDAFCAAFGLPATTLALEAMTEVGRPRSIVLEMTGQASAAAEISATIDQLRELDAWKEIRNALGRLVMPSMTGGAATELMEKGNSQPDWLPVSAARLLRYVKISTLRDNFLKAAGPISDQLETIQRSPEKASSWPS